MLTRRTAILLPAATAAAAAMPGAAHAGSPAILPESYDEPLGIGFEGWPYPAPTHFLPLHMAGQPLRMAYMDVAPAGAPNGQTAVLLHGKNFDGSYWSGVIAWLTQAGFRVVVPDQIGFNKSSKPDLAYSFEALAANTILLLDTLALRRVDLIGHSTGGMLAVRLAAAYPERVERLVLEDPIGLVDYREFVPPQPTEVLEEAERRQTVKTYRAFVAHYFTTLPAAQFEPFVEWRMRVALSGEYERFIRATALTYQMIYQEPVRDLYRTLQPPVLLFAGESDRSAPLAQYATPEQRARMPDIPTAAKAAAAEVPRCRLITLPGVGHVPHLEAADDFRQALLGFLSA